MIERERESYPGSTGREGDKKSEGYREGEREEVIIEREIVVGGE